MTHTSLRMNPGKPWLLLFLAAALLLSMPLSAQTGLSAIRGTVTDPTGAVAPGVTVVAEEVQTGVKARTVVSDSQGNYEMPDLKGGTYRIRASMSGFKTFVASDFVLASEQTKRVDIQLQVGETSVEVTVSGAAPVIETEDSKLGSEFTGTQYKFVPIPGNAYSSPLPVLATMPNVQFGAGCQWCLSMAGQNANQMGMDGVKEENTNTQTVNMEQADEVKVVAVNNSAEFSRAVYYNVVTKRGGNKLHGEASYYHRNSALGARGFYEDQKPKKLYHTLNLSASGPIIKDKTFFFVMWNGERVPQKTFHLADVPTEQMRTGNFSQLLGIENPVTIIDPTTGNPFQGNVIPTDRISSVARKTTDLYIPAPDRGGPGALVNNLGWIFPYPEDQYRADVIIARVDHQISKNNSIYGRISAYLPRYVLSGPYPNFAWTRLRQSHSWAIVDTHVVSPSVINTFTFGGNRDRLSDGEKVDGYQPPTGDKAVSAIGLEGVNPKGYSAMGFPIISITGYSTLYSVPGGVRIDKNFSYADSVSWSTGRHVAKFGTEIRTFSTYNGTIPDNTYGAFNFDGRFTGNAYADFLLGMPASSTRLDPLVKRKQLAKEIGLFATDTFKVTSKLNLDYGIRWDYFGSPHWADGLQYNWDPATGDVMVPQSAVAKISPLYDPRIKVVAGDAVAKMDKGNFAPRIGAAYRLTGKTVIRGGYGIFTESIGWGPYVYSGSFGGGPFEIAETYQNRIVNGAPMFSFPNPFPAGTGLADVPGQGVSGYPREVKNGYVQQYNVTVEHQVKDVGLRLSYIGSKGDNLNYWLETNKPQPSLEPFTDSRRPFPQFYSTYYNRRNGATKYNSMTLEASRKVGKLMFDAHWTWAHNMSNMFNTENPYAALLWNRDFQAKHRLVLNAIYDLPFGKGARFLNGIPGWADQVIGGWKFYWISFLQGGQYFSPGFSGFDPSNTNSYGGLPDRIGNGNISPGQRTMERWFDVGAFAVPGCPNSEPVCGSPANIGRFGNGGVNILEGPGLQSHSMSIAKQFRITERLSFNFTGMISNLFNHPNFYAPQSDITAPGQAGVISGQHDFFSSEKSGPRLVEFRARLEF